MQIAQIGSTKYDTLAAASNAIKDGDAVDVLRSGQGADVPVPFTKPGKFKLIGKLDDKGAIPKLIIDLYTRPAWGKAIVDLEDGAYEIANLHMEGCAVPDSNGAAIRINSTAEDVYVHHVRLVNNENGILTGGGTATLTLEDAILDGNGRSTQNDRQGYSHNIYNGNMQSFIARRVSFLNSVYGHDLKSRALYNELQQVVCSGAKKGRALDLPNGGVLHATDCEFRKDADAGQNNLIDIGAEGITSGIKEEYIFTNCLFHNDVDPARDVEFIRNRSKVEVVLVDPLFTGAAAKKDQKQTLKGNVRIVLTGGPLGPRVQAGGNPPPTSDAEIQQPGQTTAAPPATTPPSSTSPSAPATSMTLVTDPGTAGTWAKAADEGATVTLPAGTIVRYGANGSYLFAKVAGKFTVNNQFFTKDPAPKIAKAMDVFTPAGSSTPSNPTPSDGIDAEALAAKLTAAFGDILTITVKK